MSSLHVAEASQDQPLIERPVTQAPLLLSPGGWLEADLKRSTTRHLQRELAIRGLLELDTQDQAAVLDFMNEHGRITRPFRRETAALDLSSLEPRQDAEPHLLDAVAFLTAAKSLSSHWLAHHEGRPLAPIWQAAGFACHSDDYAWIWFRDCLNDGLDVYAPTIRLVDDRPPAISYQGRRTADLYDGLCLQIFNLVVEQLPPRRCGFNRCHNYFVRQGEAKANQHRLKGVAYCSTACRKAADQQRRRDRRRAQVAPQKEFGG